MNRAAKRRVEQLCEVSRELEKLGPMYLALRLLQEIYARETLEQLAFGNGNIEVAVQAAIGRARRMLTPPGIAELTAAAHRTERHARRLRGMLDLSERVRLKSEGQPLPDKRRRPKAPA